jgi:hypothetical protein
MNKHRYIKTTCLLLAVIVMACGKSPTTTEPTTTAGTASASQPASKIFPPEYRVLAAAITRPMIDTSSMPPKANMNIAELIAATQSRILDLQGIHSSDGDINYVSNSAAETIEDLLKQIEALEISAKSRPNASSSSVGLLVSAAVAIGTSNPIPLLDVFTQGAEHQDEVNSQITAWIQERHVEILHISSDNEKLQAAAMLLPKIAAKYAVPPSTNDRNMNVHFVEAWGPMGPDDTLSINNNGVDIADCTISIKLIGATGEEHTNVHLSHSGKAKPQSPLTTSMGF